MKYLHIAAETWVHPRKKSDPHAHTNTSEILYSTKEHVQPGCTPAQITWTKWNLQLAHQWKNIQLKCSIHPFSIYCLSIHLLHFLSQTDRGSWFKTIYKGRNAIEQILGKKGLGTTLRKKYVYSSLLLISPLQVYNIYFDAKLKLTCFIWVGSLWCLVHFSSKRPPR